LSAIIAVKGGEGVSKELEALTLPLLAWYRDNKRTLPWREDPTPYHVLVSEVMLQQTRVAAVVEYYRRFLEELPTVEALAGCPEDRLMKLWQGLGYYNRARNLQKAAVRIVSLGGFPGTYRELLGLNGVGEYTAGAIASIAFGQAVPAVDGNVLRVITRVTGDFSDISEPSTKKKIAGDLAKIIPIEAPGDFNQALMELGAVVCVPNGAPACEKCPLRELCGAKREDWVDKLPVKGAKRARRIEERVVWLVFHEGRVALRRRPKKGLLAGLWEYPNDLLGAVCPVEGEARFAATAKHIFTHMEWHMTGYEVEAGSGELPEGWIWADKKALRGEYAIPSAFQGFDRVVTERLERKGER